MVGRTGFVLTVGSTKCIAFWTRSLRRSLRSRALQPSGCNDQSSPEYFQFYLTHLRRWLSLPL